MLLLLVGGGLLGGVQNPGQMGLGLGSTSTSGGLFGNQQQLKLGGGGLFGNNTCKLWQCWNLRSRDFSPDCYC